LVSKRKPPAFTAVGVAGPDHFQPRAELSQPEAHTAGRSGDAEAFFKPCPGVSGAPKAALCQLLFELLAGLGVKPAGKSAPGFAGLEACDAAAAIAIKPDLDHGPATPDMPRNLTQGELPLEP
jgi:hypothetical protein